MAALEIAQLPSNFHFHGNIRRTALDGTSSLRVHVNWRTLDEFRLNNAAADVLLISD